MSHNPLLDIQENPFSNFISAADLKHPIWKQSAVGLGKRIALKMHECDRRARRCANQPNGRRMRHHANEFNKLAEKVGFRIDTHWIDRKALNKHRAVFGQSGVGNTSNDNEVNYG